MDLFDFDGTLVDSNGVWVDVDNGFLARRGLTPTREYSDAVGHSIFPIAAQYTKDYYHLDMSPEEIMAEWLDMARDAYAHQVPLKPGAGEFLAHRAGEGADMALVTACVPELCRAALARHGLERYFSAVVYVQELGVEKRDPRAFALTLKRLGGAGVGLHPLRGLPRGLQGRPGHGHRRGGGVRPLLRHVRGGDEAALPPVYPQLY